MMTADKVKEAQATEFSPTELAALRERREALSSQWVEAVRAEASQGKDGEVSLEAGLSPDTQEHIERLSREYEVVSATIKEHEHAKERADLVKAEEDLTSSAPRYRDLQAKREALFFQNLMEVGRGEYKSEVSNPDLKAGEHPGSLRIPQPLIARNEKGQNQVYPVAAVFSGDKADWNEPANIEASFRQAEIIQADKFGQFNPITGNRVPDAPVGRQMEAVLGFEDDTANPRVDGNWADTYLNQGGMLYQYEIQRNELARYMDIKQVPYVNEFLIDRRTAIGGDVGLVREGGDISGIDSTFDTISITPRKYAHFRGMTYESSMLAEPWSTSQTLMTDAGIAMGNIVGKHIVTGSGTTSGGTNMSTQWQGLLTWAKAAASNRQSLGARGTFLSSSGSTFGVYEMATFVTQLAKEYFRAPNKLLSMRLATWGKFMGQEDTQGRKLFTSIPTTEALSLPDYNLRVVIDENWDTGANANDVPWFFGDFTSACLVYYGPTRVDFSKEYAWISDRLYWRFISHRGFAIVDPNGFFGGQVT